jgi:hypothetical protein
MASGIVHVDFIPPVAPPMVYPTAAPSSLNGGTDTPDPAPPMVIPPPASSGIVSFAPAPTIAPRLTVISPVTTQRQINTTFRIVDARLNSVST